jgi:dTDP-glucose 4,6-dehydratase
MASIDGSGDTGSRSRSPRLFVAGGAGFIGSNFVHAAIADGVRVLNFDKLTYAGNLDNLAALAGHAGYTFVRGDITQRDAVARALMEHRPTAVVNFAAETHVDRSIDDPGEFIHTNVVGTFHLLEATRAYLGTLPAEEADQFRFVQVSTDEVYGSLGPTGLFSEETRYAPSSPYAASKAAGDHLVRAYHVTYGLPAIVTSCSNNYGPYQFPEKLIPLMIMNALEGKPLPVYGDGKNVRDWLYVGDHCDALRLVLARGVPGEAYNIGGASERTNIEVVEAISELLDELAPAGDNRALDGKGLRSYRELITFVRDRPGHDRRYAIDATKIRRELGWRPAHPFADGLRETVAWYQSHRAWCARITEGVYRRERLGLTGPVAGAPPTR